MKGHFKAGHILAGISGVLLLGVAFSLVKNSTFIVKMLRRFSNFNIMSDRHFLVPLDGIIIVTSPQELVSMIVEKAVKMANMMNIPILGVVENMSYYVCPDCGKKHYPFGESKLDKTAKEYGLDILARLPIDPDEARACDEGKIETVINDDAKAAADKIEEKCSVEKE